MTFDVTNLNLKTLIKAVFAYAEPAGLGIAEYATRKSWNENVDGLTDSECEEILAEFYETKDKYIRVLDYYKGKPMKLDFIKKTNGRIVIGTGAYDARNGKYRFFEAMLDTFLEEEILIVKKGYGEYSFDSHAKHLIRPKSDLSMFKLVLKNSIEKREDFGRYWKIDSNKKDYTSPIMKLFKE